MAVQKIDQDFVLSDSSQNVLGMRLLTSGYMVDEFKKNPIGYYGHKKDDGVLLKWDDVRLDGDRVLGKPVINMEHPRAERTVKEIEDGFLNCASVGKLCILDYELEDNPDDPNDPIVVVGRWYNKETSLVDNPGNRNAMKVELCDEDEQEINLADLVELSKKKILSNNMKTVTLPVIPELLSLLSLSGDDTTAEAVVAGIKSLHGENARLSTELTKERETQAESKLNHILDKGLEDGKYNVETRDALRLKFKGKPQDLEDVVKTMGKYVPLTEKLKEKTGAEIELADKTYDELDKANLMPQVKKDHPELYKQKFKAKFGKEPKM